MSLRVELAKTNLKDQRFGRGRVLEIGRGDGRGRFVLGQGGSRPRQENERKGQGIEGFHCVVFHGVPAGLDGSLPPWGYGSAHYSVASVRQARVSAVAARSTAGSLVARPNVNRIEPRAASAGMPIANKTAEADSPPSWHAEPVDAAISGVAARRASPETRGKRTLSVLGRRFSTLPFR